MSETLKNHEKEPTRTPEDEEALQINDPKQALESLASYIKNSPDHGEDSPYMYSVNVLRGEAEGNESEALSALLLFVESEQGKLEGSKDSETKEIAETLNGLRRVEEVFKSEQEKKQRQQDKIDEAVKLLEEQESDIQKMLELDKKLAILDDSQKSNLTTEIDALSSAIKTLNYRNPRSGHSPDDFYRKEIREYAEKKIKELGWTISLDDVRAMVEESKRPENESRAA